MSGAAHCPCCGQAVPDLPRLDSLVVALGLAGDMKRLFTVLSAARGRYLTASELAEIMWGDREDGGPLQAPIALRVMILRLRVAMEKYPVQVQLKSAHFGLACRLTTRWTIANSKTINHIATGYQLVKVAA